MERGIRPTNWQCPSCGSRHSKPHWPDYHQKEPGWKDKLKHGGGAKSSDPAFEFVCEDCGHELGYKPATKDEAVSWCNKCKKTIKNTDALYCKICGSHLTTKPKERNWCTECKAIRVGIPAPLFCPHCGWTQERVVLMKVAA